MILRPKIVFEQFAVAAEFVFSLQPKTRFKEAVGGLKTAKIVKLMDERQLAVWGFNPYVGARRHLHFFEDERHQKAVIGDIDWHLKDLGVSDPELLTPLSSVGSPV